MITRSTTFVKGEEYDTNPLPNINSIKDISRLSPYDAVRVYDNGHYDDNALALTALATVIFNANCSKSMIAVKQGSERKYGKVAKQIVAQISYIQPDFIPLVDVSDDELMRPYLDSPKNALTESDIFERDHPHEAERIRSNFGGSNL